MSKHFPYPISHIHLTTVPVKMHKKILFNKESQRNETKGCNGVRNSPFRRASICLNKDTSLTRANILQYFP